MQDAEDKDNVSVDKAQLLEGKIEKAPTREIPLDKIRISEFCKRGSYNDLDSLVKSIHEHGLVVPVAAREDGNGQYILIYGSRRYYAHQQLQKTTIRAHILDIDDEQAATLSFEENSTSQKLHPVERARKLKAMMDEFGWTQKQLGKKLALSQNTISEHLGILKLDSDILNRIDTRPESPFKYTQAVLLSRLLRSGRTSSKVEVRQLFKKTVKCTLPTSELKALVEIFKNNSYYHLPEQLRTYLLKSRIMDSAMVLLYFHPEKFLQGRITLTDYQFNIAKDLEKKQLNDFLCKAVKAEWPKSKIDRRLLNLIKNQENLEEKTDKSPPDSWKKLIDGASIVHQNLDVCSNEISETARGNPYNFRSACGELQKLDIKIKDFLEAAKGH